MVPFLSSLLSILTLVCDIFLVFTCLCLPRWNESVCNYKAIFCDISQFQVRGKGSYFFLIFLSGLFPPARSQLDDVPVAVLVGLFGILDASTAYPVVQFILEEVDVAASLVAGDQSLRGVTVEGVL